ncbi:MAG: hypothetical protein U0V75_07250 [Ferruginibacter sp.]
MLHYNTDRGTKMVHYKEGWFAAGGCTNGVEYNFPLICVLLTIMFPGVLKKKTAA